MADSQTSPDRQPPIWTVDMAYVVSLAVGVAVGVAYALVGVRSPAPPMVALFGLLGILIGEQGLPWVKARLGQQHAAERPASESRPDGTPLSPAPGDKP